MAESQAQSQQPSTSTSPVAAAAAAASSAAASAAPVPPSPSGSPRQPYACVICSQRKVKCDKRQPCLACTKSRLPCRYRAYPPPPRRRKRAFDLDGREESPEQPLSGEVLLDKLRSYEALLRGAGIAFDGVDEGGHDETSPLDSDEAGRDRSAVSGGHRVRIAVGSGWASTATSTADTAAADTLDGWASSATPADSNFTVTDEGQDTPKHDVALFPRRRGILLSEHGGKRYYEHGLIGGLGQKYRQGPLRRPDADQDTGGPGDLQLQRLHPSQMQMQVASLLVGGPMPMPVQTGDKYQHLPASTANRLWSVFLENVHPLTMVIHAPTVKRLLFDDTYPPYPTAYPGYQAYPPYPSAAAASPPKTMHALRLAIYACAVASLTDKDCREHFGEPRSVLLLDLQDATRCALNERLFQRSPDLDLLRAYVLLLTSMLNSADATSLWVMLGSAMRMAQLQGLHRDGAALHLSVFDTEMRRRLWWYMVTLESRLAEVLGSESTVPRSCDTQLPSNVNDASLDPSITTLPPDLTGTSDMVFCLLKYETVRFLQERDPRTSNVPDSDQPDSTDNMPVDNHAPHMNKSRKRKGLRSVGALERLLEERFLRFCDPIVPLHLFTTTIARSSVCKYRHMEQRGQAHPHAPSDPPPASSGHHHTSSSASTTSPNFDARAEQANNRRILQMAARNVAYDNLLHTSPSLAGFLWHVHFYFPWGAPIFILRILGAARTAAEWDADMQTAWGHILELHRHHPEFAVRDPDCVEHLLVADLTLDAWHTRESAMTASGVPRTAPQQIPAVILELQAAKEAANAALPPVSVSVSVNTAGSTGSGRELTAGEDNAMTTVDTAPHAPGYPAMATMDTAFGAQNYPLDSTLASIDWADWGSY
ncbi:hypothetical protein SBRCBS47491_007796 [Sporothrix bragantina]|uniref:Zn(2)-C6 fungal-type domain-containing protein n=1 Tax=Sporothrix bragantina TaxID=671064 RepID=A0ABP0CIM6_9PEZI